MSQTQGELSETKSRELLAIPSVKSGGRQKPCPWLAPDKATRRAAEIANRAY